MTVSPIAWLPFPEEMVFKGKLKPRKCIICGEDYLTSRYPNKSMVCRNCKRICKTRLHRLGAEKTFEYLIMKRGTEKLRNKLRNRLKRVE